MAWPHHPCAHTHSHRAPKLTVHLFSCCCCCHKESMATSHRDRPADRAREADRFMMMDVDDHDGHGATMLILLVGWLGTSRARLVGLVSGQKRDYLTFALHLGRAWLDCLSCLICSLPPPPLTLAPFHFDRVIW